MPRPLSLCRGSSSRAQFSASGAEIRRGGDRAYYAIGSDHIQMPPFEAFRDAESYYATLAHEGILVVKDGRAILLEVKNEDGRHRPEQKDFGSDAILASADYHVVRSIKEVQAAGL